MIRYSNFDDIGANAQAGKQIDRVTASLIAVLLRESKTHISETYSLEFVEPTRSGSVCDLYAHQKYLTLSYSHAWSSQGLIGRLLLCPVESSGELGPAMLEIIVTRYAVDLSDGLTFSAHQIEAAYEHHHIAAQIALRVLAVVQPTLEKLAIQS